MLEQRTRSARILLGKKVYELLGCPAKEYMHTYIYVYMYVCMMREIESIY
jgi:hypothetical protein